MSDETTAPAEQAEAKDKHHKVTGDQVKAAFAGISAMGAATLAKVTTELAKIDFEALEPDEAVAQVKTAFTKVTNAPINGHAAHTIVARLTAAVA